MRADDTAHPTGLSRRALIGRAAQISGGALAGGALTARAATALPDAATGPPSLAQTRLARLGALGAAMADSRTKVEATPLTWDDMGLAPTRFVRDGAVPALVLGTYLGYLGGGDGRPPIWFVRSWFPAATVPLVFAQTAQEMFHLQTDLHCGESYAGPVAAYLPVVGDPEGRSNDPITYQLVGAEGPGMPKLLYRCSSKSAHIVEGSFFDVRLDYLPYACVVHPPAGISPYINNLALGTGTYEGRPVTFPAGFDRLMGTGFVDFLTESFVVSLFFYGEGFDGRREWGMVLKAGDRGAAMFCRDGEPPVTTTEVQVKDARWVKDPSRARIAPQEVTFKFADKEIYYNALWGNSVWSNCGGGDATGPLGIATVSNTTGYWRDRDSPPQFKRMLAVAESHATPDQVRLVRPRPPRQLALGRGRHVRTKQGRRAVDVAVQAQNGALDGVRVVLRPAAGGRPLGTSAPIKLGEGDRRVVRVKLRKSLRRGLYRFEAKGFSAAGVPVEGARHSRFPRA